MPDSQLADRIHYDPVTGIFTRIKTSRTDLIGKPAGYLDSHGYVIISIGRRKILAHRLAVFLMTGKWPEDDVDHEDRDTTNNRWLNLRDATRSENLWNNGTARSNTGLKCIHRRKDTGRFMVQIRANGVLHRLGNYTSLEKAKAVRDEALPRLHGEFANLTEAA